MSQSLFFRNDAIETFFSFVFCSLGLMRSIFSFSYLKRYRIVKFDSVNSMKTTNSTIIILNHYLSIIKIKQKKNSVANVKAIKKKFILSIHTCTHVNNTLCLNRTKIVHFLSFFRKKKSHFI